MQAEKHRKTLEDQEAQKMKFQRQMAALQASQLELQKQKHEDEMKQQQAMLEVHQQELLVQQEKYKAQQQLREAQRLAEESVKAGASSDSAAKLVVDQIELMKKHQEEESTKAKLRTQAELEEAQNLLPREKHMARSEYENMQEAMADKEAMMAETVAKKERELFEKEKVLGDQRIADKGNLNKLRMEQATLWARVESSQPQLPPRRPASSTAGAFGTGDDAGLQKRKADVIQKTPENTKVSDSPLFAADDDLGHWAP